MRQKITEDGFSSDGASSDCPLDDVQGMKAWTLLTMYVCKGRVQKKKYGIFHTFQNPPTPLA